MIVLLRADTMIVDIIIVVAVVIIVIFRWMWQIDWNRSTRRWP